MTTKNIHLAAYLMSEGIDLTSIDMEGRSASFIFDIERHIFIKMQGDYLRSGYLKVKHALDLLRDMLNEKIK